MNNFNFSKDYKYYKTSNTKDFIDNPNNGSEIKNEIEKRVTYWLKQLNYQENEGFGSDFQTEIGKLIDRALKVEINLLRRMENISGQKILNEYNSLSDEGKIRFWTALYFTGQSPIKITQNSKKDSSALDSKENFDAFLVDALEEISKDKRKSFVLLASSNELANRLDLKVNQVVVYTSDMKKVVDKIYEKEKEFRETAIDDIIIDESIGSWFKGALKGKIIGVKKGLGDAKKIPGQLKSSLKNYLKKNIINKTEITAEINGDTIQLAMIYPPIDFEDYQKKLDNAFEGLNLPISLYFSNIEIDENRTNFFQTIKEQARNFIKSTEFKDGIYNEYGFQTELSSKGGSLGEVAGLFGGRQLLGNKLKLTGTQLIKGQGESFSDASDDKYNGLNIKHYTSSNNEEEAFSVYGQTYKIFDNYLRPFFINEEIMSMRWLINNYNFLNESDGGLGKTNLLGIRDIFRRFIETHIQYFIRYQSRLEQKNQNTFYIINNRVIPSSIIFKNIKTQITKSTKYSKYFVTNKIIASEFGNKEKNGDNLLTNDFMNFPNESSFRFKGIKFIPNSEGLISIEPGSK